MTTPLAQADRLRESNPEEALALYLQMGAALDEDRLGWVCEQHANKPTPELIALLERVAADGENAARNRALHELGAAAWYGGRIAEARARWTQLLRENAGERDQTWLRAAVNLATCLVGERRLVEALVVTGMAKRTVTETDADPVNLAAVCLRRAELLILIGDLDRAERELAETKETLAGITERTMTVTLIESDHLMNAASYFIARGQWRDALRAAEGRIARLDGTTAIAIRCGAEFRRAMVRFELEPHARRAALTEAEEVVRHFAPREDWGRVYHRELLELQMRFALETMDDTDAALELAREWLAALRESTGDGRIYEEATTLGRRLMEDLDAPTEARQAFDIAATACLRLILQTHRVLREIPELGEATPEDWMILGAYRQRLADEQKGLRGTFARLFQPGTEAFDLIVNDDLIAWCAWCGRVRAEDQTWLPIGPYLPLGRDADFTHGICPPCRAQHFPHPTN